MATFIFPALAALVGAAVYVMSSNPKAARLGELLCFAGLLWTVYALLSHTVRL